ncbi:Agamous-like MADS-box protein AGL31 [Linum perenne]
MGRGKVEMRPIEDKSTRQVTFSKRKRGLLKKAQELSVLCGVEVAVVIFSGGGKLYEFSGGESLEKVIQRYQAHKEADAAVKENTDGTEMPACRNLVPGPDLLQMLQRHLEEKTVDHLDSTELVQLERKLESLLRGTRIRKTELMIEAVTTLYQQEVAPPPPENLVMENEVRNVPFYRNNTELSAITNHQNQQHHQQPQQDEEVEVGEFPNEQQLQQQQQQQHQQQLLLMGMHLNNNGGFIPIHQLHQHQQHQLFLMGMHLNNTTNNNNDNDNSNSSSNNNNSSSNNNNNGGSATVTAAAASAVPPLLQRDAFQKGILHFF